MEAGSSYCLERFNFVENFSAFTRNLLGNELFHDVTLISEDFEYFHANKLVLSANSEFFMGAFDNLKTTSPVIWLHEVKGEDIKSLLQFVYEGKTEVPEENLSRLLPVARKLQIRGLGETGNEKSEKECNEKK